jgi:meiotic recombination protein SPO11
MADSAPRSSLLDLGSWTPSYLSPKKEEDRPRLSAAASPVPVGEEAEQSAGRKRESAVAPRSAKRLKSSSPKLEVSSGGAQPSGEKKVDVVVVDSEDDRDRAWPAVATLKASGAESESRVVERKAAAVSHRSRSSQEEQVPPRRKAKASSEARKRRGGATVAKQSLERWESELAGKEGETLRAVEELALEMRSAPRRRQQKLADLGLANVRLEVDDIGAAETRARVERLMVLAAKSICDGLGFSFRVPVRSSGNQLYVPEIDRIVLKDAVTERSFSQPSLARKTVIMTRIMQLVYELCAKGIHVTKRDLFYTDVKLFQSQKESDVVIDDVACMVGCTRSSLHVVASEKGIVVGRISFLDDGDPIDCTRMGVGGKAIPPYIDRITDIRGDAKFILLVEKDAAFMRLAEDRFYNSYPCIIITAKGQPDVATRLFLKKVKETLNIPVLGLVDSDPYGLKILSVYMSGSKNMSYDSASLTTADIKWLGVRPSDLDRYNIPEQCRLQMSEQDVKTGRELLEEDFIRKNPEWLAELELMVRRKEKAEIQALSNFGFQYLSKVYLPLKLREGDWI